MDNVYSAEEIVSQRLKNGKPEYQIKWLGFPDSQNTWEDAENILDKRLLECFYKKHPRAKRLDVDPDYSPNTVALLSWPGSPDSSPVIAVITGRERNISRHRFSRPNWKTESSRTAQ